MLIWLIVTRVDVGQVRPIRYGDRSRTLPSVTAKRPIGFFTESRLNWGYSRKQAKVDNITY